jgi:hypothetical protein
MSCTQTCVGPRYTTQKRRTDNAENRRSVRSHPADFYVARHIRRGDHGNIQSKKTYRQNRNLSHFSPLSGKIKEQPHQLSRIASLKFPGVRVNPRFAVGNATQLRRSESTLPICAVIISPAASTISSVSLKSPAQAPSAASSAVSAKAARLLVPGQ